MKIKNVKNKIFFLSFLSFFACASFAQAGNTDIEEKIINYINQEREKEGLGQLKESKTLNKVAEMKARDMVGNDYFAHTSPQGLDPWHWFKEADYKYKYAGENLGMDFANASSVHRAWMESPTHKENIMSSNYDEIGVAVLDGIIDKQETKVAVQSFGRKLNGEKTEVESVINGLNNSPQEKTENTEKSEEKTEEEKQEEEEKVIISQTSVQPWQGETKNEMLVFAGVKGDIGKVQAVIGDEVFGLEKLRENVYMNLISLEDVDIENEKVSIKAISKKGKSELAQIDDERFSEYISKKRDLEKEDDKLVAMASAGGGNKFMNIIREWINKSGLIVVVVGLFVLTIANVWILEKEEERLLNMKNH
ncbi:MAG: CAP domain-containing protein [Candidatus Moraniibacteriota bacterium]